MSRPADDPELVGIPGTRKGMGIRVGRKTRVMGVTALGRGLPVPIEGEGAGQRTIVELPEVCPECGGYGVSCYEETGGYGQARRVSCFSCGWDAFLVRPPQAALIESVEIERGFLNGQRVVVRLEGTGGRAAKPRRVDRRKRPTLIPEKPTGFRRNGGIQIFP